MPPFLWSQRDLAIVSTAAYVNGTSTTVVPNTALIMAYNVLYIVGAILLTILSLVAWLFGKIKRKELWFMTLFSWWLASVNYVLLIGQQVGQDPNPGLCLVQAMLVYASPAFAAATTAAFMVQIYYTLDPSSSFHRTRVWSILLHVTPVLILLSIMMAVLLVGPILKYETITRDPSGMYCHIMANHVNLPLILTGMSSSCSAIIILVIEVYVFRFIRRIPNDPYRLPAINPTLIRDISKRVMIFSIWSAVCISLSLIEVIPAENDLNPELQVFQATLPSVAAIIFGTQKDLMRIWMFWRKKDPYEQYF